jgi:tRNA A37 threonylcarbamoyladenosine biosynthesis protein TsaE
VDLYRLQPIEVTDLGLDELTAGEAIVAVEWAERWGERPAAAWEIYFEHEGADQRKIRIPHPGSRIPASGSIPPGSSALPS